MIQAYSTGERTDPVGYHSSEPTALPVDGTCGLRDSGLTSPWCSSPCAYPGWSYAASGGPTVTHVVKCGCQVQKHYLIKRLISRCAESCIRCLVLVVLRGPSLIYHGGNRLVLKEAVDPPLSRWNCVLTSPES